MDEMSQKPFLLWQAIVRPCRVFVYLSFVLFTTMSVMLIILRRDIFFVEWMSVLKLVHGPKKPTTFVWLLDNIFIYGIKCMLYFEKALMHCIFSCALLLQIALISLSLVKSSLPVNRSHNGNTQTPLFLHQKIYLNMASFPRQILFDHRRLTSHIRRAEGGWGRWISPLSLYNWNCFAAKNTSSLWWFMAPKGLIFLVVKVVRAWQHVTERSSNQKHSLLLSRLQVRNSLDCQHFRSDVTRMVHIPMFVVSSLRPIFWGVCRCFLV